MSKIEIITFDEQSVVEGICKIARTAGEKILDIYQRDFDIHIKADSSPLTEADLAAHQIIAAGLAELTPDIPVLSEEDADIDWSVRQTWKQFWLVDPLDGTKEFINRNGEFTVNIALIEEGRPALAVVYAPVLGKLYFTDKQHAYLTTAEKANIRLQVEKPTDTLKVVGSRSHPSPDLAEYLQKLGKHEMVAVGSSLKFCLIAEGSANIYPRLGPTMEWDTGAGHCVAEKAGAVVCNLDGQALRYNQKESLLNPYFEVKAL
ncbi:3'(2'),5'-bisphosphate nucleotidase CysQ [Psychromonas ossibalaenae]|uniref:3'(2'),5'-bisphosphate nucleotidase CysQ n=1 Tax=Psychromonas ossibalaenae TaxID=444922 RepID=UPI0003702A44|nr:3'(2'),5'-bisphosphate nucleotidase CysQ [Psychromonas ossibalaenae]